MGQGNLDQQQPRKNIEKRDKRKHTRKKDRLVRGQDRIRLPGAYSDGGGWDGVVRGAGQDAFERPSELLSFFDKNNKKNNNFL